MESLKANQVQQGILTSGIGAKKRGEVTTQQQMEEQALERKSQLATQTAETARKYTLDQVKLGRQAAEQARARAIGGQTEADYTKEQAMKTAGITDINQIGSAAELARKQTERGISPIYDKTALTDLNAQKVQARESTAQELQNDELARRQQEYGLIQQKLARKRAEYA